MCLRLWQFSQLSFMQYMGLCIFSIPISLTMIIRIPVLDLIIIIKSEECYRLGLGRETMVCAYVFLYDAIKWKHISCYWPFMWGIHRSLANSPHKGQWRGALVFSLICARTNGWVNNGDAGDLRRHRAHHDVILMTQCMHALTFGKSL